jgi:hypothetical protein
MNSKEIKFPVSEHVYFGSAIIKTFYQPYENVNQSPGPVRFPVEIKELEKMLKLWNEGLQLMHVAMENIYGVKRPAGERLAALGKFIRNSIITTINCKRWWMLNIALQGSDSAELALSILDKLKKIIVSEIKNAEDTLPAVECDSRLGWEPSMGYVCDSWHLKWKVRQMESVLEEIKKYRHTINL